MPSRTACVTKGMVKFFDDIPAFLSSWIERHKLFQVASAPLTPTGNINVSPKGIQGTVHIVNANIARVRENGRITATSGAFDGPPRIVRVFEKGAQSPYLGPYPIYHLLAYTAHEIGTPEGETLLPSELGLHAVIRG